MAKEHENLSKLFSKDSLESMENAQQYVDENVYGNPLYEIKLEDAYLHLADGNRKLGKGILNFSVLPGNSENVLTIRENKILLTNVVGTCSRHCEGCFNGGCYAVNSAKLHHNMVIKAWADNTLLLRAGVVFELIAKEIKKRNSKYYKTKDPKDLKVKLFRINVSGEIENETQFEEWNNLAKQFPEVTFGLYTKNFEDLEKFMQKNGDTADNFVINISQWHHVADEFLAKYPGKFNVFEYDNSNRKNHGFSNEDLERLAHTVHCPAVNFKGRHIQDKNGNNITCTKCGRCYRKTRQTTAVYDH